MKSATAYPLAWPPGWPRTPAHQQQSGAQFVKFGYREGTTYKTSRPITFEQARKSLSDELDRIDAAHVVISTDLPLRRDGMPYAEALRAKNDQGVAVYFMLKGRAMVMAQDAYSNMAANMRSLAMAIEAMRALERHGGGAMMERAFSGFTALPPATPPKRSWREVLGFEEGEEVTAGDIGTNYKYLARKHHPDRPGGSATAMAELNAARDEALIEVTPE